MKNLTLICAIILLSFSSAFAQKSKVISAKINRESGELARAKADIDQASAHEQTKNEAKTWLEFAQVYYRLSIDESDHYAEHREGAILKAAEGIQKAYALREGEKKYFMTDLKSLAERVSEASLGRGGAVYEQKAYADAYHHFMATYELDELLNKIDPEVYSINYDAYYYAAAAAEHENMPVAKDILATLIEVDYPNEMIYISLASIESKAGNNKRAEELFDAGLKAYPGNQNVLLTMIQHYLLNGRENEVIEEIKQAVANEPENIRLQHVLAAAYMKMGSIQSDRGYLELGDAFAQKAIETYQLCLKANPDDYIANYNIGKTYHDGMINTIKQMNELDLAENDKYEDFAAKEKQAASQAIEYFEKVIQLHQDGKAGGVPAAQELQVWQILADLYLRVENVDKAKEARERISTFK